MVNELEQKDLEIQRLRTALIEQVSRTRQYQEIVEICQEAIKDYRRGVLTEFACITAIGFLVSPPKITTKDIERAQELFLVIGNTIGFYK